MIIWPIIVSVIIFAVLPVSIGTAVLVMLGMQVSMKKGYVFGWLIMLALFEVIVVPAVFLKSSLTGLTLVYTVSVVLFLLISGGICLWKKKDYKKESIQKKQERASIYTILGIVLVILQVIVAVFFIHIDTDDAYYIGTANSSLTTDTLFLIEPDTGYPSVTFPLRYVFSAIMVFWAYLSKMTGIHPLIVTHTIIPGIFISISYFLWWEIGKLLFKEKEKQGIFFLLTNVLNIFGNTSIYTQASFLLFRIWQGKAMLPNIILPAILLTFLQIYQYPKRKRIWFAVLIIVCAACCCSSMAVPLGMIVVAAASCVIALLRRRWKFLVYGFLCCIPCLVIGIAYLILQ